ncbi:MAG: DNA recombination protein RmuC [Proteobacteria bacterium]|nr:DNA recombination protein RmuC [Pseudomonadota bacterium]
MEWLYALIGLGFGIVIGGLAGMLWARRSADEKKASEIATLQTQLEAWRTNLNENMQRQTETANKQLANLQSAMTTNLQDQQKNISESIKKQAEATSTRLATLTEKMQGVDKLSAEATRLANVLSSNPARGAFGGRQLETLVEEMLGKQSPNSPYKFQATLPKKGTKSGTVRVDCLLNLPNPPGPIAIDAKFPLSAWEKLNNAKNTVEENAARKQMVRDVVNHINKIADDYIISGHTSEGAIMFIPSETIYAEIHTEEMKPALDASYDKRVYIASPTTLMATLNTVRAILRDVEMTKNIEFIKREVGELLKDINNLDERVGKLKRHFDQAQQDVTDIRMSTDAITHTGKSIGKIETNRLPNTSSTNTPLPPKSDEADDEET